VTLRSVSALAATLTLGGCSNTPPPVDGGDLVSHDTGLTPRDVGPDMGSPDSGPRTCAEGYAGCTVATAMDLTGRTDTIVISVLGGTTTDPIYHYDTPCIRVRAHATISITNTTLHPLASASCSSPDSPITRTPTASTFVFDLPNDYGYFCRNHGLDNGTRMAGMIIVE